MEDETNGWMRPKPTESDDPTVEIDDKPTLDTLLRRFLGGVIQPEDKNTPITVRIKACYGDTAPRIGEASRNTFEDVLRWTRAGSPLRALGVVSVGTILLLALTGFLVFMLFFLVATFNAALVSLLMSLAAAGGVLAIFFTFLTAIYVGALLVAASVISTIIISATIAVLVATGWVGFFWLVWLVAKKSLDLTKQSITVTGSAISAYKARP